MTNNQPPADTVMLGPIRAALWENQAEKGTRYYSVTFERRYRDAESGSWKSSSSFNRDDLLTLAKVADMAHTRIHELQSLSRSQQRDGAEGEPQNEMQSPPPANSAGGSRAPGVAAPARTAKARAKADVTR